MKKLIVLMLFSFSLSLTGQENWKNYLAAWAVQDLNIDKDTIWISTMEGGLVKYNSKSGKATFLNHANSAIPQNNVNGSVRADSSSLLVCSGGYLTRYQNNKFSILKVPGVSKIDKFFVDNKCVIWAYADNAYLIKLDSGKVTKWGINIPFSYYFTVNDMAFDYENTAWIATSKGLYKIKNDSLIHIDEISAEVYSLAICKTDGRLWIGTKGNGLYCYDGIQYKNYSTENSCLSGINIYSMSFDSRDYLWIAAWNSIIKFKPGECRIYETYNTGYNYPKLYTIGVDSSDVVWCGSIGYDLFRLDSNAMTHISISNAPFFYANVFDISTGDSGFIWTAANSNLYKLKNDSFHAVLKAKKISCYTNDKYGNTWVAFESSDTLLIKINKNGTTETFDSANSLLENQTIARSMVVDSAGTLWIAYRCGLFSYNGTSWKRYDKSNSGLTSFFIRSMAVDKDNVLWMGADNDYYFDTAISNYVTMPGGLFTFDGTSWGQPFQVVPAELTPITAVCIDSKNRVWINYNGIAYYDGYGWVYYNEGNSAIPMKYVLTIFADDSSHIWLGSLGGPGLVNFNPEKNIWKTYTVENSGLSGDVVNVITQTPDGNIWMAGTGICMFNPKISGSVNYKLDTISKMNLFCSEIYFPEPVPIPEPEPKPDTTSLPGNSSFAVYPNPVSDMLTIAVPDYPGFTVSIYSAAGEILYQKKMSEYTLQVNMAEYSSGIYLIRLQSENVIVTRKIIKN